MVAKIGLLWRARSGKNLRPPQPGMKGSRTRRPIINERWAAASRGRMNKVSYAVWAPPPLSDEAALARWHGLRRL